jgi:hypothetical protein
VDPSIKTEAFTPADQSWLASAHGTANGRPVTLDVSAFTAGTHYPDGFFKSGIPLGKITSSGLYAPYGASPGEAQTLTFDATGGVYTLVFDGETTPSLTYLNTSGDTAVIQAALEALSNINPGDVTVTRGTPAGAITIFTVTFGGQWAGKNVPQMTNTETLTGGSTTLVHGTTTAGGGATADGSETGVGFLLDAPKAPAVNTTDVQGAILLHCMVIESKLPIAVDAAFKADVAGRIIFL